MFNNYKNYGLDEIPQRWCIKCGKKLEEWEEDELCEECAKEVDMEALE